MSDITVGPIQTYINDSTLSAPTVNQSSTQNVSVALADSNLWLVDTSKLNGQTIDPTAQFTLINLQTKYQTTVPFDNVTYNVAAIIPGGVTTNASAYLQSNLPQGDLFMLTSVTGGTQISSDGMSLSAGSSGSDTGGTTSSATTGGLSGGDGSSGSGGAGSLGSGAAAGSSLSAAATQAAQSVTAAPQAIVSPQATVSQQPAVNAQDPVPVPFKVSPTIGLLLVLLLFSHKFLLRRRAFKAISAKITS